jgi:membrane AbrB-like protein
LRFSGGSAKHWRMSRFQPRKALPVIETLLIGAAGGLAFEYLRLPAGLIVGSTLAVAVVALAGRPLHIPPLMFRFILIAIGIILGAAITPATIAGLATYPLSIAILLLSVTCVMLATAFYLRLVHRWDSLSAMLGASPGARSQILAIAVERQLDVRALAILHMVRVMMLIVALPFGLALLGLGGSPGMALPAMTQNLSPGEIALLLLASIVPAWLLTRIGFTGGWLFGAMLGSATLHGMGWIAGSLPRLPVVAIILALGAATGVRFSGTSPRLLLRYLGAAFGSFATGIAVTAVFVVAVEWLAPVRLGDALAAFAPGAQDTMMVLAISMNLDPVFIGAHHASRFVFVSLIIAGAMAFIYRAVPKRDQS